MLKWVAISFSRGSARPRDRVRSSALQADSLLSEPPGKPSYTTYMKNFNVISVRKHVLNNSFVVKVRLGTKHTEDNNIVVLIVFLIFIDLELNKCQ